MSSVDVSVIVPVYNNAATIEELIDRLVVVLEAQQVSFELIFVDDFSRDASLAILQRRAAGDPHVRVFALSRNFGNQAASSAACEQARGRRVVHLDADLENLPEDIPRLLDPLERGYDLVCGYRENRRAPWLTRRLPSRLVNLYVRRQTGTDLRDVGCGLRAFDARLIHNLAAEGEGRRMLMGVLLRRARRVAQVPVRHHPRLGRSEHSFLRLLAIALDYFMLTAQRPFLITGLLSTAALLLGLVLLAFRPRLAGLLLAGIGGLGGLLSLIGQYAQRLYQLGQGMPFYQLRDLDAEERSIQQTARREQRSAAEPDRD
jgi:glycosyltransferase involved in cell wall biosynthesis